MRVAIIGRTEVLYEAALKLKKQGYEIALIITAKEAPEYQKTADDFLVLAKEWDIPYVCTSRIMDVYEKVRSIPLIDIGVSLNYIGIIPQAMIDLFPLGILNAHSGDLPRYRGNACQAWAIINGETRIGLCIHQMIGGELDSGAILAREYYPININTKVTEVYQWFSERVPFLFLDALNKISFDPLFVLEVQSEQNALRCYPRRPEDGRIDWRGTNEQILRLINASNKPYSGAFCTFSDRSMIIWDAELADDNENYCAIAGQVIHISKHYIDVACGKGKLRVKQVEIDGVVDCPSVWIKSIRNRLL